MFDLPTSIYCSHKPARHTENYRICDVCNVQQETVLAFRQLPNSREYSTTCINCLMTGKGTTMKKPTKQSPIRQAISRQLHNSHTRMLDNALKQEVEVTCPKKLRDMYPDFTDEQITRMARLNHKINVANDFLIEEQYYYLNPSERPAEGIEYHGHLFEERVFDEDEELAIIQQEQVDIDDK